MSREPGPRDWDKELAAIDKIIASGGGDAPPPVRAGSGGAARGPGRPSAAAPDRRATLFTWLRLGLALSLGAAMTQWPYVHGCGWPLYAYLAAVITVLVASFWSLLSSWRSRSALAHFLSIGLLFWGAVLGAREVLPRIGYAKTPASWTCSA